VEIVSANVRGTRQSFSMPIGLKSEVITMGAHTQPPDPDTVRRFQDNDDESIEHEEERDAPKQPDTRDNPHPRSR
jgi:hypothetical protein